jgi:hypothetical protein
MVFMSVDHPPWCTCPKDSPFNWHSYPRMIVWKGKHDGKSERAAEAKQRLEDEGRLRKTFL